jgi:hypothetical protein
VTEANEALHGILERYDHMRTSAASADTRRTARKNDEEH